MRFLQVTDEYNKTPYWVVAVSTLSELQTWYLNSPLHKDSVADVMNNVNTGAHSTTPVGNVFEFRKRELGQQYNYFAASDEVQRLILNPRIKAIENGETVLITAVGAWCTLLKDYFTILEDRELDEWPVVEGEIRVIQWPGGKHWYAKVGPHDVVVDNQQKWDTMDEAQRAAELFITNRV